MHPARYAGVRQPPQRSDGDDDTFDMRQVGSTVVGRCCSLIVDSVDRPQLHHASWPGTLLLHLFQLAFQLVDEAGGGVVHGHGYTADVDCGSAVRTTSQICCRAIPSAILHPLDLTPKQRMEASSAVVAGYADV